MLIIFFQQKEDTKKLDISFYVLETDRVKMIDDEEYWTGAQEFETIIKVIAGNTIKDHFFPPTLHGFNHLIIHGEKQKDNTVCVWRRTKCWDRI